MESAERKRRFLVVTPNVVMGEDLRDVLSTRGGGPVDVVRSLTTEQLADYSLAIFDISRDLNAADPGLQALRRHGTEIVFLCDGLSGSAGNEAEFIQLSQPFTTDDIVSLLRRTSLLTE